MRPAKSGHTTSVTLLISFVVCGRKAPKSICQQASPGFPRLCSGQALRLRAINPLLCDRSARRFAPTARRGRQDDAFLEGIKPHLVGCKKHEKIKKVSQDDGFVEGLNQLVAGSGGQNISPVITVFLFVCALRSEGGCRNAFPQGETTMRSLTMLKVPAGFIAAVLAVASLAPAAQAQEQDPGFSAQVNVPFAFQTATGQHFNPGIYTTV